MRSGQSNFFMSAGVKKRLATTILSVDYPCLEESSLNYPCSISFVIEKYVP